MDKFLPVFFRDLHYYKTLKIGTKIKALSGLGLHCEEHSANDLDFLRAAPLAVQRDARQGEAVVGVATKPIGAEDVFCREGAIASDISASVLVLKNHSDRAKGTDWGRRQECATAWHGGAGIPHGGESIIP